MAEWSLNVGTVCWQVKVPDERVLLAPPSPAALAGSLRQHVAAALEKPLDFEPMRRALTPDDHVCIVLDERMPLMHEIIGGVLDHLVAAGIDLDAITLVSPDRGSQQSWIEELPEEFADVKVETHDADDRRRLSYLASTKGGDRIYLNRAVGEADFVIVLALERYESSGESLLVPGLCDRHFQGKAAETEHLDSREIIWLLGTPFFVRVIEGANGGVHEVVCGFTATREEAARRQRSAWTRTVMEQPDTVVIVPQSACFTELCDALAHAERVVAAGGRIVAILGQRPRFPPAMKLLRQMADAAMAMTNLQSHRPEGWKNACRWIDFSSRAALFFAGALSRDECESVYGTAISTEAELQRLLDASRKVLFLPDAHLNRLDFFEKGTS